MGSAVSVAARGLLNINECHHAKIADTPFGIGFEFALNAARDAQLAVAKTEGAGEVSLCTATPAFIGFGAESQSHSIAKLRGIWTSFPKTGGTACDQIDLPRLTVSRSEVNSDTDIRTRQRSDRDRLLKSHFNCHAFELNAPNGHVTTIWCGHEQEDKRS